MLTQRAPALARFTRNDATRLGIASGILVLVLTAILAVDILPQESLQLQVGDLAPHDLVAQRALDYDSDVLTADARDKARAGSRSSRLHDRQSDRDRRADSSSRRYGDALGRHRVPRRALRRSSACRS